MRRVVLAALLTCLAVGTAAAQSCDSQAVSDGRTAASPALNVARRSVMMLRMANQPTRTALCLTLRPRVCRSPTARFAPIVLASRLWPGNPPTFFAPLAPRVAPGAAMPPPRWAVDRADQTRRDALA
jgi:hypothetical protein